MTPTKTKTILLIIFPVIPAPPKPLGIKLEINEMTNVREISSAHSKMKIEGLTLNIKVRLE